MKIAIVHEWIIQIGGAEKVLQALLQLYPNASIYTLVADPKTLHLLNINPEKVHTSFIQHLPFSLRYYRQYFPLFPLAVEQFDLRHYDVILSSSHCVAKGVLTHTEQLHICYCHSPVRYVWDLYQEYLQLKKYNKGPFSFIVRYLLHRLRMWDTLTAQRPDYFLANSNYIATRIKKVYRREATVIYPPVESKCFKPSRAITKEDFYLNVARMVPYKKIKIIAEAFLTMPQKKLVLIGDGPEYTHIKKITRNAPNIQLLGYQHTPIIIDYMQRAKGFIFMAREDFGITPVEAQAAATPVIAYNKGGIRETVLHGITGILFNEQNEESLKEAIILFENTTFNTDALYRQAAQFSTDHFQQKIHSFIQKHFLS